MPKVTYIDYAGTNRCIDAEDGMSLMEVAVNNNVPGIDGDCGGECACATCHPSAASTNKRPTCSH
jgi:2Fe-2S ferredoxin